MAFCGWTFSSTPKNVYKETKKRKKARHGKGGIATTLCVGHKCCYKIEKKFSKYLESKLEILNSHFKEYF